MPMYEFKCEECRKTFSELRNVGKDRDVPCQFCGSVKTRKLVTSFASFSGKSSPSCSPTGG